MRPGNVSANPDGDSVIYDHVILVLRGVSFEVPQGKIGALLDANRAGKSTTLKSVSTSCWPRRTLTWR